MEIDGRIVVITGGGGGIGRALAEAFAAAGAGAVVVADLDGAAAERVATRLREAGHEALGLRCDVALEADTVAVVDATVAAFGRIDIFCANAGIVVPGGVEVPDAQWERIWEVNVRSHVHAARAVVPAMLERGEGYLIITASAAGLLTQIGSAPYAVTKHAAVALAEWLSITHGDAGLRVSCLCPQGVWTAMTGAPDEDIDGDGLQSEFAVSTAGRDGMLLPAEVAAAVIEAVGDERFLILPHPVVADYEVRRASERERWLRGMRRVNAQVMGSGPAV
ncbi:MAG: SDR family oxidoreductase [Acidobacteria bacterium]|nr:SDR family oxidoreductase [Acidobacteriota bacterium]